METVVRSTLNIVYNCHYHVVFCPKYRRKVLVDGIDDRLKVLIQTGVERYEQEFVQVEVMPDYVHLLVGCDPQCGYPSVSKVCEGFNCPRITTRVVSRTETETSLSLDEELLCWNGWWCDD